MYEQKISAYRTARRMGHRITVIGPELPAWAEPLTDAHIKVRTHPATEMAVALDELRRCHAIDPFDGVVTFWDHGVAPAADVAEALGLPGAAGAPGARTARNKAAMRAALAAAGVPCPASARVTGWAELAAAADRIGYPAIYKPTGGAGSAGIFRVDSADTLRAAYDEGAKYAAPAADPFFAYYPGEFVYEEFLTGCEVSVEGVVSGGDIQISGVTDKVVDPDGYFTEYQNSFPALIGEDERRAAIGTATAAVAALGLDACGFHVEVMIGDAPQAGPGGEAVAGSGPSGAAGRAPTGNSTGKSGRSPVARVVEVNARLGGGFIASHLVPLAGGDDLLAAAVDAALGRPVRLGKEPDRGSCNRYLLAERPGTVREWTGLEAARACPGVAELNLLKQVGDTVTLPPESFFGHQLAHVVTVGADPAQAVRRAEHALGLLRCRIG